MNAEDIEAWKKLTALRRKEAREEAIKRANRERMAAWETKLARHYGVAITSRAQAHDLNMRYCKELCDRLRRESKNG